MSQGWEGQLAPAPIGWHATSGSKLPFLTLRHSDLSLNRFGLNDYSNLSH